MARTWIFFAETLFLVGWFYLVNWRNVRSDDWFWKGRDGEPRSNRVSTKDPWRRVHSGKPRILRTCIVRVTSYPRYEQRVNGLKGSGFLVCDIAVKNTDNRTLSIPLFDWKLSTPFFELLDPINTALTSGTEEIFPGQEGRGTLIFQIGQQQGQFTLAYRLGTLPAAWDVKVKSGQPTNNS